MADKPDLRAQQLAFAAHVRDPGACPPPPGVEERRLRVYRSLFLDSIGGLLAGNFPVIRRIAGGLRIAELAHYEWVELALQISEADVAPPAGRPVGACRIALSPLARPLAYAWPVHRIGPDFRPTDLPEAPTLLLARRDGEGDVRFSALSPLVYRLLQLLDGDTGARDADQVLATLASEAGASGDADFLASGQAMLDRLVDEGTVLRTLC